MSQILQPLRPPAGRPPLRRLAMLVGVWIALAGGALLIANALDTPAGQSARDAAQPAAPGPVATNDARTAALPPFAMVLDHPLPARLSGLAPARQAQELRTVAMSTKDPVRFVELGSVLQVVGDQASARFSYRSALRFDPGSLSAMVGLAVIRGGEGAAGLADADRRLASLAATHPGEQIVRFNQAWVAIYRGRAAVADVQLKRTVALGAQTRLGRTAAALIAALEKIRAGQTP